MSPVYIIGDIHGHYVQLIDLLKNDACLIRADLTWIGEKTTLCLMGDYFDRGPDGIKVVDFLISLQIQAEMTGGQVIALLGNHDVMTLAAHRFGELQTEGPGGNFLSDWQNGGGVKRDLDQLTPEHIAWLTHLPAMALVSDRLLVHADALFYTRYGNTIEAVNQAFETILRGFDPLAWDTLLERFSQRYAFLENPDSAQAFLDNYGGKQIIHGHTTIAHMTNTPPEAVWQAHIYAGGLCVNVDHGLYRGGPGFVYLLPPLP